MPSLEILKPGLLCSIQDMGRKGLAYYAIPPAGVMDSNAAKIALLLLNLNEGAPLIECTSIAPRLYFNDACTIAISGADFSWTLNTRPIAPNSVINIRAGDILGGKIATDGFRGYIAIKGALRVDKVYGSYATYTNAGMGGYQGRLLQKGDVLEWAADPLANSTEDNRVPIQPGPEFDYLNDEAKQLLVDQSYTISKDSNRMGLRLEGSPLENDNYQLAHSLPVLPGFVQLPPNGLPIVILQDGQTSGGYPRIAYVQEKHLSVLNQIPLGGRLGFRWT